MSQSLALCGAGFIAGAHAAAARELGLPVVAVASRSAARAQELANQVGARAVSYEGLPAQASLVAVCTPPQMHAADTLRMVRAGAAVMVEKPLCTTLADADAVVSAAEQHHQPVLYAENLAYAPVVQLLLARVVALGQITHLEVRTIQSLPTWGNFTSDEWGGGALFDLGMHPLAVAVLAAGAAGAGPVVAVNASLEGGDGHNSDEHADVSLTFRSGLVGRVVASWRGRPGQQQWDVQISSDSGVLRIDFWPEPTLEYNGDVVALTPSTATAPFLDHLGYCDQLAAFAADARRGARPFMDVQFGRMMLDIVCCAYQSAGRGGATEPVPFIGDRTRTPLQLWHATFGH